MFAKLIQITKQLQLWSITNKLHKFQVSQVYKAGWLTDCYQCNQPQTELSLQKQDQRMKAFCFPENCECLKDYLFLFLEGSSGLVLNLKLSVNLLSNP